MLFYKLLRLVSKGYVNTGGGICILNLPAPPVYLLALRPATAASGATVSQRVMVINIAVG
ncbi:hypothetical protein ACFLYF_00655 [Chloroflexota bacterium]